MRGLFHAIPDVDVLVGLEPEELGAKLLFVLRHHAGTFSVEGILQQLDQLGHFNTNEGDPAP